MKLEIVTGGPSPAVVKSLLTGLPEWFGIPEAVDQYVADSATLPTVLATDDANEPVGVLVHRRHFPESVEIHVMAVARGRHRQGIGRALIDGLVTHARAEGARLISVKTLGPTNPDAGYAKTRAFYRACGFLPVEELPELWGEHNPCLLMVMPIG